MTNDNGSARRMAEALATAQTFTRAQMADVIARALASGEPDEVTWRAGYEAGYWARVAEENAAYPGEPHVVVSGVTVRRDQVAARETAAADRTQRHVGGPVADWGPSRPDLPDLGPSAARWHPRSGIPLRRTAQGYVWAEA